MEAGIPTGVRVLVVDDEPSLCLLLGDVLIAQGYQPIICTHPRDALAVSERETFELAFIDINLPEVSGLELASRLRNQDPLREVVFITGYGTFDDAVQAIKIGAYDYLRKPFSTNELEFCLRRFQERQALREKARLAEQRYFRLVQNLPLLIYIMSRDYHLEFVNQACEAMLGYAPEEARNIPNWLLKTVHADDRERIRASFELAFDSGGSPFSQECRLIHKKGHLIHAIVKPITASRCETSNKVERLEGIIVDITDRVFLEKALVHEEKLKTLGTISAEVAHEIRNPLVAIGGFARRLQRKFPGLLECDIILRETQRLEKMLARIRNYLKPVEIRHQECSVTAVIGDCLELLSPELERKRVMCRLDLDPGLSAVTVDPDVMTQVFINLVRNAAEAMEKGGSLIIKTYESDQNLHIDFRNPVPGPVAKDPELLFLPLGHGGKSIGLPLCHRLVKKMGGVLSLTQEQNHAVFTVSLPKAAGESTQIAQAAESKEALQEARMATEKRRHARAEVSWPCTLQTAVRSIEGAVKNISAGGAFISCKNLLVSNEIFQTVIETADRKSLSFTGTVVWSNFNGTNENDTPRGIGTRFTKISNKDRQFLYEMISGQ